MTPGTLRVAARLSTTGLLVAGLTALPAPAPAIPGSTIFTQSADLFLGDDDHQWDSGGAISFGAGGGPATPHPSTLEIPHLARIVDVDLRIIGLTHTNPDDIRLVLVQQGGPQVTLMANGGGSGDASNLALVFDDEAAQQLPDEATLASGDYRPAAYGSVTGNTSLAAFDGLPASTTWQLFAFDDDGSDHTGSIGGWDLYIDFETAPYPSELAVSGLGTVRDVDVRLHGFTSTYADDVDAMLVAPDGRRVTLMSDAGGNGEISALELTFDDEAATPPPDEPPSGEALQSGTYRPADVNDGPDSYPAPAPPPPGGTDLSVFDGSDPNGIWRLYAVDDSGGDLTSISGWSLDIDWDDSAAPTGSVSVAGGVAATRTSSVTLDLAAIDPAPATGVKEMRFSNDGTTYSAFTPYAATAAWALGKGDGTKTVFAQFRDAAGNVSAASSDTVVLDTTNPGAKKLRPRKNATDVKPKAKVRVVATEALDPATVTKRSVVLKHDGVKVKAKVTYVAARHTIVLKPNKLLKPGDYKVIVKTRVADLVGNRFDTKKKKGLQRLTWSFTVG